MLFSNRRQRAHGATILADDSDELVSPLAEFAENVLYDLEPYPCGYFYSAEKILRETMEPALQKFLAEVTLLIRHADGSVEELDAHKYFDDLWDYLCGNENADCKAADLIAKSVEKFMEQGEWHCGLASTAAEEKLHPVVWFGLPGEEPSEYWTIDPCAEDAVKIWLTEMDWSDILADDPWDCVSFWAYECGIYLPDRSKLLDSCPIKIYDGMTSEELRRAVEAACKNFRQ